MTRDEILNRANECVTDTRQKLYGPAIVNATNIAALWTIWLQGRGLLDQGVELGPHDAMILMGLLKVARLISDPSNQDSFVDCCGYVALAGEMLTK